MALERRGPACLPRASSMFTATKIVSTYDCLFLCISRGPTERRCREVDLRMRWEVKTMSRWCKWKLKNAAWNWPCIWTLLLLTAIVFYTPSLFLSSSPLPLLDTTEAGFRVRIPWSGDLRQLETSWNRLRLGSNPSREPLKIAVFVKKWPAREMAGGLERHARTLHRALAKLGHTVHVFTSATAGDRNPAGEPPRMHFHFSDPTPAGNLDAGQAWEQFVRANATQEGGFHIIHTESVALPHAKAQDLSNVVVSWHGIAYEIIHSEVVQELLRNPNEPRPLYLQRALTDRLVRVVEEVRFFAAYAHHVATSDYAGDVLRTVYMLPPEKVHVIVNGVDETLFRPAADRGAAFRLRYGVPLDARLVMGMAGRLVKDKGHPLVFEALKDLFLNGSHRDVFVLIAGNGPWASRYGGLAPNVKVVGALASSQLPDFYNALDIFVNPTLRSQGLDHTLPEAMLCGKPLLATHFWSITRSVIVSEEVGYTFSPRLESVRGALERVIADGNEVLEKKGQACLRRASSMFTATKMASAYERLFLCISRHVEFCKYPLPSD